MSRIVTSIVSGLLLLCGAIAAIAAAERLPADVRAALEQTNHFQNINSVSAIPESVRVAFTRAVRDTTFAMAEPGAKWQATDAIIERNLPWRRFQAGAASPDLLVLLYEHGGIGHSYHVCVFRLTADGAQLVWRAVRPKEVIDLDDLNRAIQSGVVRDDPKYHF